MTLPDEHSNEEAVRAAVVRLIRAMGSYDVDSMREMFMPAANIGFASVRDGHWVRGLMTADDFIADLEAEVDPVHYDEPIKELSLHIDGGQLAVLRADATLIVDGEPVRQNIDCFTLINDEGTWRFANASYVGKPTGPAK